MAYSRAIASAEAVFLVKWQELFKVSDIKEHDAALGANLVSFMDEKLGLAKLDPSESAQRIQTFLDSTDVESEMCQQAKSILRLSDAEKSRCTQKVDYARWPKHQIIDEEDLAADVVRFVNHHLIRLLSVFEHLTSHFDNDELKEVKPSDRFDDLLVDCHCLKFNIGDEIVTPKRGPDAFICSDSEWSADYQAFQRASASLIFEDIWFSYQILCEWIRHEASLLRPGATGYDPIFTFLIAREKGLIRESLLFVQLIREKLIYLAKDVQTIRTARNRMPFAIFETDGKPGFVVPINQKRLDGDLRLLADLPPAEKEDAKVDLLFDEVVKTTLSLKFGDEKLVHVDQLRSQHGESASKTSLKEMRSRGLKDPSDIVGIDTAGRVWRKKSSSGKDTWYVTETLLSMQQATPLARKAKNLAAKNNSVKLSNKKNKTLPVVKDPGSASTRSDSRRSTKPKR